MILRGTTFQRVGAPAPPPAPPELPVAHDTPTQPSLRKPTSFAITLARARPALQALITPRGPFNLAPIDWVGLVGVAAIWCAAFFLLGVLVVMLAFPEVSLDALSRSASSPTPRDAPSSTLPALLHTPLVHVGLEPLVHEPLASATPTPPRATPRATGRPPLVLPTPAK
jgi:hypothetical protein